MDTVILEFSATAQLVKKTPRFLWNSKSSELLHNILSMGHILGPHQVSTPYSPY
jgi:hypothetical protein